MRKKKGAIAFLLVAAMILVTINSAMAGRGKEVGVENPIDIVLDKGAKGKAFNGILSHYYVWQPGYSPENVDMIVMMRLHNPSTWFPFAGIFRNIIYTDTGTQALLMQQFLDDHVVPKLVSWGVVGAGAVAKFRHYSNIVEDNEADFPSCCSYNVNPWEYPYIRYVIMDIEVAIRD